MAQSMNGADSLVSQVLILVLFSVCPYRYVLQDAVEACDH